MVSAHDGSRFVGARHANRLPHDVGSVMFARQALELLVLALSAKLRLVLACLVAVACVGPQTPDIEGRSTAARVPMQQEVFFCRYEKNPLYLADGSLSLSAGGPTFATFTNARSAGVTLTVPWGSSEHPIAAKFTSGWVTFRTQYRPAKGFFVYSVKPVTFGVLTLDRWARLKYEGTTDDTLMLAEAEAPTEYRPLSPLRAKLRCGDTSVVATGSGGFDDQDKTDAGRPVEVELQRETDIPVSAVPDGPPEGFLRFGKSRTEKEGDDPVLAVQLEARGNAVRIRKHMAVGKVTGWVPASAVRQKRDEGLAGILGYGGLGLRGDSVGVGKPAWPRCGTGVELYLARGGALERVGDIHPSAAVVDTRETPGWTEVELPELEWLKLESGVAWALKPGALQLCRSKPAPKQ